MILIHHSIMLICSLVTPAAILTYKWWNRAWDQFSVTAKGVLSQGWVQTLEIVASIWKNAVCPWILECVLHCDPGFLDLTPSFTNAFCWSHFQLESQPGHQCCFLRAVVRASTYGSAATMTGTGPLHLSLALSPRLMSTVDILKLLALGLWSLFQVIKISFFQLQCKQISKSCEASQVCWSRLWLPFARWHFLTVLEPVTLKWRPEGIGSCSMCLWGGDLAILHSQAGFTKATINQRKTH